MGVFWAAIAAICAAGAGLIALWARFDSARSAAAAERSAVAAEESNRLAERSAAAAEESNRLALEQATKYTPGWAFVHVKSEMFALVNDSDEDALDVRLERVEPSVLAILAEPFGDMGAREHRDFVVSAHMGAGSRDLVVTWQRPGESQRRQWRSSAPHGPG